MPFLWPSRVETGAAQRRNELTGSRRRSWDGSSTWLTSAPTSGDFALKDDAVNPDNALGLIYTDNEYANMARTKPAPGKAPLVIVEHLFLALLLTTSRLQSISRLQSRGRTCDLQYLSL